MANLQACQTPCACLDGGPVLADSGHQRIVYGSTWRGPEFCFDEAALGVTEYFDAVRSQL